MTTTDTRGARATTAATPDDDPVSGRRNALADATVQDWRERARCAETDPEAFFPEKGESSLAAKRICAGCEVRDDCLQDALDRGERFGIWGGMSPRQRRAMARTAERDRRAGELPFCPWHGLGLSGGPILWRCPAGRLGHRVTAADVQDAAENRRAAA